MQYRRLILGIALALVSAVSAQAAASDTVLGDWMTPAGLKVHVAACRGNRALLCGTLVGLKEPNDKAGAPLKDAANADPGLRSRPLIGIAILKDMKASGSEAWADGKVYELKAGKTYDAKMKLQGDGTLKVEGCVAVLCRGVMWGRAN